MHPSPPASSLTPADDSLTIYQPFNCSAPSAICCMDEIMEFLSEIFYGYYEKEEVQRLLPLPFQKKYRELMSADCLQCHQWHRPLDPVPTEEEMFRMIELRRRNCRRRKKQHGSPFT